MSDLISTLAQQTLGLAAVVQPRVTSRFGPAPLVLEDAQRSVPAPSEPSPWGPPPPGLLSGGDAQAPLFSWRQMQDAAVSENAVAPVLDSEGIDIVEPLDEAVTTLSASPVAPAPQPSAGDVTTQRLVTVPVAGPAVPAGSPRPITNQEQGTFGVEEPSAQPVPRRVPSPEADLAAAVGWAAATHPAAQDPIQATGAAAFAALQTLDVLPVSAATVDPPVPSPAAQQPIDRSARTPLEHAAAPGSAPGHSTPSGLASDPAANRRTTAEPAAAPRDAAQLTSAVSGSTAGEEHALPMPATPHPHATTPAAPGVSLQTAAGTAGSPTEAGQPAAAPAAGQPMDGTSSVVPPVLVQAPLAMAGSAMNAELAPSSPATIQRQVEASTLAPVAHAPAFVGTPGSTATADPSMFAPTAFQHPVEVAAAAPPAPGHASEVGLTALVVDEPVPAAPQPAAATDARTPVTPAPAVVSAALAVPPGPTPVGPHAADAPGSASYVTGLMPIDGPHDTAVVDRPAASLAMLPNATVTTDRDTTVIDQPASSTAGQWPAQAAAVTPLTLAPVTADTVANSGVVEPPGPVPSAGPHAGETFVDAIASPVPHASPAESRSTTGAATAAPVSTSSPRISTTAVLVPGMPSPAPAAAPGATGPVNPVAPASGDIQSLTQTATLAANPSSRPSGASEWTVTADPAVSVPGAYAAETQIAAPVAPAGAAIASSVSPVVAGQVRPGTAVVQRTAESSALARGAPAGPPTVQPAARIPAAIPRAAVPAAVTPAELAAIPVTPFSTTAPAGPAARMSDTTQPPAPVPPMAPAAANLLDHTAALLSTDPRMVETIATAPQTRSAAPAGTAITGSSAAVPAPALHRGETPGPAPVIQTQTAAPGGEAAPMPATSQGTIMTPGAPNPMPGAAPGDDPAVDAVAPDLAGVLRVGETTVAGLVSHTQASLVVSDSTVARGLVPPRDPATNPNVTPPFVLSEAPDATSGILLVAAQPDSTPAAAAHVTGTTTIIPAALPLVAAAVTGRVETGGSAAGNPLAALYETGTVTGATAMSAPPAPDGATKPNRLAPVTAESSIAASTPASLVAPARSEAIGPAATGLTDRQRRGEPAFGVNDVIPQAPTAVSGTVATDHQATPEPAAARVAAIPVAVTASRQASTPTPGRIVADHPAIPMPGTITRAAETAVTAIAPAPASIVADHPTTPMPGTITRAAETAVTAIAPSPGGIVADHPAIPVPGTATRGAEIAVTAVAPSPAPIGIVADHPATPMPGTAIRAAETAVTATAPSPAPASIVADHQGIPMPGTVTRAAETAVAPAASRHAPIAIPQDMVNTNPPVPIPTAEHQPNNPPAPLPTALNPAPTAASEPATTDRASSPTLTPTSHPTDTPAIVPGAPPYSLLPTPYSVLPTPYSVLPTPYSVLPTPYPLPPTPYSLLRITIGRIDVRVTTPPPAASTRREPTRPTVSLDDYLSGGGSLP